MSKKNTKRALLSSVLALVLCLAMLTGTTFAWFTDSVTSGKNQIVAGNLDVELYHTNSYITEEKVDGLTDLFTVEEGKTVLWEPGMVVWENFTVKNAGNLALKYQLSINFSNEYKVNGKGLSDVLKVAVVDPIAANATRTEVLAAAKATGVSLASFVLPEKLLAGDSDTYGIVIYWEPSDNDNDYNMNNDNQGEVLTIDLGVSLIATQYTYEEDSFGPDYDTEAVFPIDPTTIVDSIDALKDRLASATPGTVVTLAAGEYTLDETLVLPAGVKLQGMQAGVPAVQWVNNPEAEKTVLKSNGDDVIQILQNTAEDVMADVVVDGLLIDCNNACENAIYVKKTDGEALEGIQIMNCAVINAKNNAINVRNTCGAVIKGNYVNTVADTGICLGNYWNFDLEWNGKTAYVTNNVIENVTTTENGAIQIYNGAGDVVVSGNIVKNVVSSDSTASSNGYLDLPRASIVVEDVYEGGLIIIENNTVENVEQGIAVYKYSYLDYYNEDWYEAATVEKVIIRNNTVKDFTVFGIATGSLNYEDSLQTLVEITDNEISSVVTNNALLVEMTNQYGQTTTNWLVTAAGNTLNGADSNAVNGTYSN